tara:strand:+ start:1451 stop:1570 length:120 start_codon:yes stop_codon:yes gene_type:complete
MSLPHISVGFGKVYGCLDIFVCGCGTDEQMKEVIKRNVI